MSISTYKQHLDGVTKMQNRKSIVKAVAVPMPVRAAPITLIGVMAVALCAAVVASQAVVLVSSL